MYATPGLEHLDLLSARRAAALVPTHRTKAWNKHNLLAIVRVKRGAGFSKGGFSPVYVTARSHLDTDLVGFSGRTGISAAFLASRLASS